MSVVLASEPVISQPETKDSSTNGVKSHPISVVVYDKMIEHRILDENDKVELLNGVLIEK